MGLYRVPAEKALEEDNKSHVLKLTFSSADRPAFNGANSQWTQGDFRILGSLYIPCHCEMSATLELCSIGKGYVEDCLYRGLYKGSEHLHQSQKGVCSHIDITQKENLLLAT